MPAILAADIGGLFAILFLLISFVGWIMNMINAQNPPPAPNRGPQRRPRARDRKVQNEIEQFLQEAMGKKQRGPQAEVRPDEIEVLEPGPSKRAARRQPKPEPRPTVQQQAEPERRRPGGSVSSRQMASGAETGSDVSSHVQDHMRERVAQESNTHLPHTVDQNVNKHLGEFTADDFDTRSTVKPVHRSRAAITDPAALINDLRSKDGMRKAVLLQEILARPRALRK